MKKVSVIIPCFNSEAFISNALKSVEKQNYENIEVLVIDDGSTDNTGEIVSEIKSSTLEIKSLKNNHSKGPSGARNTGLDESTGEYIAFLDSDDVWLDGHIRMAVKYLDKYEQINAILCDFNVVNYDSNEILFKWFDKKKILFSLPMVPLESDLKVITENIYSGLIVESFFHLTSTIIRKNVLDGIHFDESVKHAEDRDFGIQLSKKENLGLAIFDKTTSNYYRREGSLTSTPNIKTHINASSDRIYLFKKYIETFDLEKKQLILTKKILAEELSQLAYSYRKSNSFNDALSASRLGLTYRITIRVLKEFIKALISKYTPNFIQ